ncbi:MAG: glycosyltransferase 87 family protein, partial [Promethearchaeota archaeon]
DVGVYIWDILRILATIYVAKNIHKITENEKDQIFFFVLSGIGYFSDMYLNNINWLLMLFLFASYLALENEQKWIAGVLFALACIKINVLIFPFILLLVHRIKFKDLVYFIIPLGILCIPYIIYPDYFFQMYYNWTYIETETTSKMSFLMRLYLISWQAFQPAQLMYISIIALIFLLNIENEKWHNTFRLLIFFFLIILNLSFPIILWQLS